MNRWIKHTLFGLGAVSVCAAAQAQQQIALPASTDEYRESCFSQKAFDFMSNMKNFGKVPAFFVHQKESGECVPVTMSMKTASDLNHFIERYEFTDAIRHGRTTEMYQVNQILALYGKVTDYNSAKRYAENMPRCRRAIPQGLAQIIPEPQRH